MKKTQQNLSTTLENTEQVLGGLENSLGNNEKVNLLATAEDREANDGLPEGWCETTLGKFTDYGKTKKVERKDVSDDLWLLELEDVEKGSSKIIQRLSVSERAFKSTKNKFEKGSVLYGKLRPYLNKIVMAPEDGVCTTEIIPINVEPFGSNKYLFYWLKSGEFLGYVNKVSYGVNMPRLGTKDGLAAPLILPPLAEQAVIAQTLDTLLAQVDNIKNRLDAIPKILKTFRQSVLAAAVSGQLTEEWRGENKCGRSEDEILNDIESYKYKAWLAAQESKYEAKGKWPKTDSWKNKYKKAEIDPDFKQRDLPSGWVFQPLEGLVYIAARIGWKGLKASEYTEFGPLFLSVHSLNYGREVKLSEAFHISEDRYEESPEIMLENDDILLCKDGAGIGKIGIVKGLVDAASINSSLLLVRSGKYFVPEFLYFFLAGPTMQQLVQDRMTGSAVPHLFQRDVKGFTLEVPPLTEQTEIVRRVEELFAFADQIEQQVKNAQDRVNNLTQSILAKAFRGEITAQWRAENPDLISGDSPENGSAELLLAKIKTEREALKKISKPKKKTAVSASSEKGTSK